MVALGAPGVIYVPQSAPRVLVGVRMDIAAFAGVAPRGPAFELADPHAWAFPDGVVRTRSVPVVVGSWDDYAERFGSFEGPGLLPYAVAAFFQQGGQRALIPSRSCTIRTICARWPPCWKKAATA